MEIFCSFSIIILTLHKLVKFHLFFFMFYTLKGGIMKLSFGRLAPPRFCFGDSIVMPDLIRHPEKLDTGSEAGMTKAPSAEAEPRDNINRSRAAQAAESEGGIIKLSFGRLAPPRFCFGDSIVMPDLIRHPVHLAPRLTRGHAVSKPVLSVAEGEQSKLVS